MLANDFNGTYKHKKMNQMMKRNLYVKIQTTFPLTHSFITDICIWAAAHSQDFWQPIYCCFLFLCWAELSLVLRICRQKFPGVLMTPPPQPICFPTFPLAFQPAYHLFFNQPIYAFQSPSAIQPANRLFNRPICFSAGPSSWQPAHLLFNQPIRFSISLSVLFKAHLLFNQPICYSTGPSAFPPAHLICNQPIWFSTSPSGFQRAHLLFDQQICFSTCLSALQTCLYHFQPAHLLLKLTSCFSTSLSAFKSAHFLFNHPVCFLTLQA